MKLTFYFRYFINYLLDTTVGLFVIWILLRILHTIASKKGWIRLRMGEYGKNISFSLAFILYQKLFQLILEF